MAFARLKKKVSIQAVYWSRFGLTFVSFLYKSSHFKRKISLTFLLVLLFSALCTCTVGSDKATFVQHNSFLSHILLENPFFLTASQPVL